MPINIKDCIYLLINFVTYILYFFHFFIKQKIHLKNKIK